MKVWLVWTEQGEYEQYSKDLRGVFETVALAEAFCGAILAAKGDATIEPNVTLSEAPHLVTEYCMADWVDAQGRLSPPKLTSGSLPRNFGEERSARPRWHHEAVEFKSDIGPWNREDMPDRFVKVTGTNKEQVKAEHQRLVEVARTYIDQHQKGA